MTPEAIYAILSVIIVSFISLIGIVTISLSKRLLNKILLLLVSFSAGVMLGGAFLHLLPEGLAQSEFAFISALAGIIFFLVIEKVVHWRHCHIPPSKNHPHAFAYMNLVGDGVHNLIDGLVIGGAYMVDISLGIATTIAVIFHEIPQEIGDFGVLVHGGFSRAKALLMNLATAFVAIIGVVIAIILHMFVQQAITFIVPFAAGAFIYIACSDLFPQLHANACEPDILRRSATQVFFVVLGILVMFFL